MCPGSQFWYYATANQAATAVIMGQARCLALQEHRDEARAILDRMMADRAGTRWSGMADELLAALPRLKTATPRPEFQDALNLLGQQIAPAAESEGSESATEIEGSETLVEEAMVEEAVVEEAAPLAAPAEDVE